MIRVILLGLAFVIALLPWAVFPLMQHAIDRTPKFWIVWGVVGLFIIGWIILYTISFRRK